MPSGLASRSGISAGHGENVEAAYAGQEDSYQHAGTSLDKVKGML